MTMTKEEAIMRLKQNRAAAAFYAEVSNRTKTIESELLDVEAFNMAIEALSAEPKTGEWEIEKYNFCPNCGADMRRYERRIMTKEMKLFRKMLDDNGIEWHDASDMDAYPMTRTHFNYRGHDWSVIHGYCSYGGYSLLEEDKGLLELMSDAVNDGDPVGNLTAKEAFDYVRGDKE